jgi:hypothetical protein
MYCGLYILNPYNSSNLTFPHSHHQSRGVHHILGGVFYSVLVSVLDVLPAVMSQVLLPRDRLYVCGTAADAPDISHSQCRVFS